MNSCFKFGDFFLYFILRWLGKKLRTFIERLRPKVTTIKESKKL